MNLPLFIARRYLISKKKQNIINIISGISVAGVTVGTFALVVVLSVFNGFNDLIRSYFSILDPDLKITPVEGKLFDPTFFSDSIQHKVPGIADFSFVIEENALLKYETRQFIATVKGVPTNFANTTGIDELMIDGTFLLDQNGIQYAVPGQGVASNLGMNLNFNDPLHIYVPKKGIRTSVNLANSLNHDYILPSGVFSLLEEVDNRYVFVPLSFARNLFETGDMVSAIEIRLEDNVSVSTVSDQLKNLLGEQFHVKNKYQQHDMLYKTMQSEKWATYLILVFILVIASFNILGSLSLLIIDKKDDIAILRSMGASPSLIRKIFLYEGWLITVTGVFAGLFLGIMVSLAQIHFQWITLPGNGSFVITAYPVKIDPIDLALITAVVLSIGFLAAWYPVRYISGKHLILNPAAR
ncbi:ABC-type transport system [Bacteroidales bacterium 6E]|nr:ABC-type transport system [Bacteroidales bacterium 6E]